MSTSLLGKRPRSGYLAAKAKAIAKRMRSSAVVVAKKPQITHGWPRGPQTAEFKVIDVDISGAANSAAQLFLLNGTQRGSDINNRIGRVITIKSIQLNFSHYATDATGLDQTHRFLLVYDKQANGVVPAIADILLASSPWAPRNLNNRNRFIILWDQTTSVCGNVAAGLANGNLRIADKKYYRRHNLKTQYNTGDAGSIADISTGSLYFIAVGSVAAGVTAGEMIGTARMRFIDN